MLEEYDDSKTEDKETAYDVFQYILTSSLLLVNFLLEVVFVNQLLYLGGLFVDIDGFYNLYELIQ